jgi:hypothetical protein
MVAGNILTLGAQVEIAALQFVGVLVDNPVWDAAL